MISLLPRRAVPFYVIDDLNLIQQVNPDILSKGVSCVQCKPRVADARWTLSSRILAHPAMPALIPQAVLSSIIT
jgi:hypothetical protein